ncbi:ankyrin repeat domain-containing protein [Halodesulfovibrio sp.]|uniref:ankyrin repeat domain-containing protein n=1 Tax=Halodesulfovibrio sp. TaxID=1912772 RepID=UPI0025BE3684|nr:ankyrin repeat domain-containing protein [Halodesulfovibrio sp.]
MNYTVVELLQHVPDYMKLVQENEIEIVELLLGLGMVLPCKFKSDDFLSPMAMACEKGCLEIVKLLWRYGASIEAEIKTHIPPLHATIRGGQVEIVCWLLEHGADVTSRYGGYYWRGRFMDEVDAVTLAAYLDEEIELMLTTEISGELR